MMIRIRRTISGDDDAAVLSRREMLAGIGLAGVFVVAGSTLLASTPADARVKTLVVEPGDDAAQSEVAEAKLDPERDLDAELTEFSAQPWRRQRRRYYRRGLRRGRRYWRRRARVVCRRRWFRGRLVRVCRRIWW
jgi:hypothetical protein